MKHKISKLVVALGLILSINLMAKAHEGHEHEDDNGTKLISNHPLTGTWVAKSSLDSDSRKFHIGHEHQPKRTVILTLNLCGNGETLVGAVEQIKLIDAPKKLNVESATITDSSEEGEGFTEYTIELNSLKNNDIAVTMLSTTTDVANEMIVSFDSGETSYTAKQKKSKASQPCLKLLNAQDDETDE